jgi:integrase
MATVRERGKGNWYARYTVGGKRRETPIPARTKSEAQSIANELERKHARIRLGLEDAPSLMTIGECFERYYPTTKALRSHETVGFRFRKWILPRLKDFQLHQLTPADVDRFLGSCAAEGLKPQSVKHLRNHLSALFTFAIDRERCFRGPNPVRQSRHVDVPDKAPRYINAESVMRVIDAAPEYYRGIIATGFYTGLRRSELWSLKPSDVDLKRRVLSVISPKTGKYRPVPIPQALVPYLKEALEDARSEWLFPSKDGEQLSANSQLNDRLAVAIKRAGLIQGFSHSCRRKGCGFRERRAQGLEEGCPRCGFKLTVTPVPVKFTFKDMRSTHATLAYEATGDIRYVQRVLGHSDPRLTERVYAGMRTERMLEQADRIDFGARSLAPYLPHSTTESDLTGPIPTQPATQKPEQNRGETK